MNPDMILSIVELRSAYVKAQLQYDPHSTEEALKEEFNRAILKYVAMEFEDLSQYCKESSRLCFGSDISDYLNFAAGVAQGSSEEAMKFAIGPEVFIPGHDHEEDNDA